MTAEDKCVLIEDEKQLEKALKERDKLFILFYASGCPFSQKFLPVFMKSSKECPACHLRILADEQEELFDDYGIEVYPTVIYFENGKAAKRLDGIFHQGLNPEQLKDFIRQCGC